jgi:hypothetical protein
VLKHGNLLADEWDLDGTLWLSEGRTLQRSHFEYPVVEFKVNSKATDCR